PAPDFAAFQERHETTCVGDPAERQAAPTTYDHAGFHYVIDGGKGLVRRTKPRKVPGEVRLGVLSSIRDFEKETKANLDDFLAKFRAADVDAVLVNGDVAINEHEIEPILRYVAKLDVPVLAVIGNAENRSAFNRAAALAHQDAPNVLNTDLVRTLDLDGWDAVSLPGYYDPKYTHQSGYCMYSRDDVRALGKLAKELEGPVVLLSHGPPRQTGPEALDFVSPKVGNVGDETLALVLKKNPIPFGAFGHIGEAGGRATDLAGTTEIPPGQLSDTLYVNPGWANSLPWRMNRGPTNYGRAAILTIVGKQAKWEGFVSPQRIGKSNEARMRSTEPRMKNGK
ncbi:MAG: hypothetical protein RL199_701, partial [Pseudomonadota bacterium]